MLYKCIKKTSELPKKTLTLCSHHKWLFNAWEIPLTNIIPSKKDGIVVQALHVSHWATSKTRLNIGKDFDQLLWTYIVGQVKLSWQKNNGTYRWDIYCHCHRKTEQKLLTALSLM